MGGPLTTIQKITIPNGNPVGSETNDLLNDHINEFLPTYDVNIEKVLGTQPLYDGNSIRTKTIFNDTVISNRMGVLGEAIGIDCKGCPTVVAQLSGTWVGTVTFEGRADAGNYTAVGGNTSATVIGALVTTATTNGIYRFNTAGLQRFQVRISAYTSGTISVAIVASGEISIIPQPSAASGSQSQLLAQRATTYELNTYDTNLATVLGVAALFRLGFTAVEQIVAPTQSPTQPTTYAANMYSKYPQQFPRLRVEVGGDKKVPYAQEQDTNRLLTSSPEIFSLVEQILLQLKIANQLYMDSNSLPFPSGWEEIK